MIANYRAGADQGLRAVSPSDPVPEMRPGGRGGGAPPRARWGGGYDLRHRFPDGERRRLLPRSLSWNCRVKYLAMSHAPRLVSLTPLQPRFHPLFTPSTALVQSILLYPPSLCVSCYRDYRTPVPATDASTLPPPCCVRWSGVAFHPLPPHPLPPDPSRISISPHPLLETLRSRRVVWNVLSSDRLFETYKAVVSVPHVMTA